MCAEPRTVPDVATVAAPKPAPRSHVERAVCLDCGHKYRCNVRAGIYTTCPRCGFFNPGEKMRAGLARLGVTKGEPRPKKTPPSRRRANGASPVPIAPGAVVPLADGDAQQGGSAPAAPPKRVPRIGAGPRKSPALPKEPPAGDVRTDSPPAASRRRNLFDRLMFGGEK